MKTTLSRATSALALGAWLSMGLPSLAGAAAGSAEAPASPAVQTPVEPLQELDEVWVRGKKLARRISDAEDDFFDRYNRLNKKADFRISCGYFKLDKNSMVMRRDCIPAFAETKPMSSAYPAGRFGRVGGCGRGSYIASSGWGESDQTGCSIRQIMESRVYILDSPLTVRAVPVSPQRRKEYATHVLKLIMTDDDLRAKSEDLAVLYKEFDAAQQDYIQLKRARALEARPPQPRTHPRS